MPPGIPSATPVAVGRPCLSFPAIPPETPKSNTESTERANSRWLAYPPSRPTQMAPPLTAARSYRPEATFSPLIASRTRPHRNGSSALFRLRQQLPTFGARRLIREFDLPISHGALLAVLCSPQPTKQTSAHGQVVQQLNPRLSSFACRHPQRSIPTADTCA